jgi:hypothetical protein
MADMDVDAELEAIGALGALADGSRYCEFSILKIVHEIVR